MGVRSPWMEPNQNLFKRLSHIFQNKTYHEFVEFERFESFEFDPLEFDPLEFLHSLFSVRLVADDRVDDRVSIVDVSALCVLTLSSSA